MKFLISLMLRVDDFLLDNIAQPISNFLEKVSYGKNCFWFATAYLNLFFVVLVGWYVFITTYLLFNGYTVSFYMAICFAILAFLLDTAFFGYEQTVHDFEESSKEKHRDDHRFVRIVSILFLIFYCSAKVRIFSGQIYLHELISVILGMLALFSGCAIACQPSNYLGSSKKAPK